MAADPNWGNVTLLLHMDGANDGTTFTDDCGHTMTPSGGIVTKTGQYRFASASAYYGSTGSTGAKLTTPSSSDFNFGTGDFTVEMWVYFTAAGNVPTIFDTRSADGDSGLVIYRNSGSAYAFSAGLARASASGVVNNTWHHLAVTRSSGSVRVFVDGVSGTAATYSSSITCPGSLTIGHKSASNQTIPGYIDEVRITKGVARYTSDFTPPSEPFSAASEINDTFFSQGWVAEVPHISGTITESVDVTDWDITALRADSGDLVRRITVSGSTYDIGLATIEPVFVALTPSITAWTRLPFLISTNAPSVAHPIMLNRPGQRRALWQTTILHGPVSQGLRSR
jgi:hypothetical protein